MNFNFRKILSFALVIFLCLAAMPSVTVVPVLASSYYTESDLSNIRCTIISDSSHASYVNDMMKYHIMSSTDNERVARNLQSGRKVVFFFDGCSDNVNDSTYGNYNRYRLSAYCAVVKEVNGVPKIVYESENCSTIPDNPRNTSLNSGSAVPTVLDGVYNILSVNHLGRYAALHIADNSGSAPVIRCTSSSSYLSTSSAINIHARSNFSSAPTNGISSSSYSSTGCFIVGLTNNSWSEYNSFINQSLGISKAIITTPYSSGTWTKCSAGVDNGVIVVDRYNYKTQLKAIYGGDNSNTASSLVSKITAYTDNIGYSGHTTHTYTGTHYEAAHPHRVYQICSCGATRYTGATQTVSTCDTCNPVSVSDKYKGVLPFKGYLVGTSKVYPCSTAHLSSETGGEIWSTDECTVTEVYTNGACKVTYPVGSSTRTAYTSLSNFIANTSTALTPQVVENQVTTYIRAGTDSTVYGYIGAGDTVYKLGTSGNMTQIFYPLSSGGYKAAWVPTEKITDSAANNWFDSYCPIKGYPCATANFEVYESDRSTYAGKIFTSDFCTINTVYSDGWCQVTYPISSGTKTAYTPINNFIFDTSFTHRKYTATSQTTVYKTQSLGADPGWYIGAGDDFYVVSVQGGASQVLYPIAEQYGGGYKLGWIPNTALPSMSYTIMYDANGGTNAPDTQNKTHGVNINLRTSIPEKYYNVTFNFNNSTGEGILQQVFCEFLGWATRPDATTATYQAGDSLNVDDNVILYAVWGNPTLPQDIIPTNDINIFEGWYTDAVEGKLISPLTPISSDMTVFAHWIYATYDITYDANGGNGAPEKQTKDLDETVSISSTIPTRENYTFVGWALREDPTLVKYFPGEDYTENVSASLVAVWKCDFSPKFEIGESRGKAGDIVVVPISISENPGIISARLKINYDSDVLTLVEVADGGIFGEYKFGDSLAANPYIVSWSNGTSRSNYMVSGDLVYLSFKISRNANVGRIPVSLSYDSEEIFDIGLNNVEFDVVNGAVVVVDDENVDSDLPQVVVDTVNARAGETVSVTIAVKNNPGISAFDLSIDYDSSLTLVEILYNDEIVGTYSKTLTKISWRNDTDFFDDWIFATFIFYVDADIGVDTYPISAICNAENAIGESVEFATLNGFIDVVPPKVGDVDADGLIAASDTVEMMKLLLGDIVTEDFHYSVCDVNGDGIIDLLDLLRLKRYLADNTVQLG